MKIERRTIVLVCVAGVLACVSGLAQEAGGKFSITVGRAGIKGIEEFRIVKTESGYQVTGKATLERPGGVVEMTQELTLDAARQPLRYKLEAVVGGMKQVIEALRESDSFLLRAQAGAAKQEKSVEHHANTQVLDNLVVSHYQVLIDAYVNHSGERETWWLLVPQSLAAVRSTLRTAGADAGRLVGRDIRLDKYSLEVGANLVEMWAETGSNRLMRVAIPLQAIEIVREGFEAAAQPEGAAAEAAWEEREVLFPSDEYEMPGTFCLPRDRKGKVPAVVLVHGSGPNDRDETIGPNKPFRDLARGLAAAGIASLRYDKRTFAFKGHMHGDVTVKEEVIEDAVAALKHAAGQQEVDPERVFLVGHSLGGVLAPFVAAEYPGLRGVVLLAASARPLDEVLYGQIRFQMTLQGRPEAEISGEIDKLKESFARVRSGEALDAEMVFYAPVQYWRDLFKRDQLGALARLEVPILVMHGGKDIQVLDADFQLIRKALAGRTTEQVEFRQFPDLNHLFIRVDGASTGAEYGRAGHVAPEVIETLSRWILAR